MTAFQIMMLSAHGAPEIPPGGSEDRRLKSRTGSRKGEHKYRWYDIIDPDAAKLLPSRRRLAVDTNCEDAYG